MAENTQPGTESKGTSESNPMAMGMTMAKKMMSQMNGTRISRTARVASAQGVER